MDVSSSRGPGAEAADPPSGRAPSREDGGLRAASLAVLFGLLLLLVLAVHLLAALLVALGTYLLFHRVLGFLSRRMPHRYAAALAFLLTVLVFVAVGGGIAKLVESSGSPGGNIGRLLQVLADTVARLRASLPGWVVAHLPASTEEVQRAVATWLRSHAQNLERWGQDLVRTLAHLLVGFIIGLVAAFEQARPASSPWVLLARRRVDNLLTAFAEVVAAQVRIAAVNTALTAVFLMGALPLAGIHVPLAGTLVAVTFATGLLPIVGNLVSNAAIVLITLSVSPAAAIAALAFLALVHKLEYVLNAHFVGRATSVSATVLLVSMVLLEALFGIGGLVAAPVYCAWVFMELSQAGIL